LKFSELKNKLTKKIKKSTLFQDKFGFENGIDITDDKQVIYRKNVVIKNIVFISNIMYTIIFMLATILENTSSNWLLTILLFPITFIINKMLSRLINRGSDDTLSQTMAMYVASFYMFLSAVLVYLKLKVQFDYNNSSGDSTKLFLSECGYILIYYSLLICAFYQDKKMLKNIFVWVILLVFILSFVVTYPIVQKTNKDASVLVTLKDLFNSSQIVDISIRILLIALYMLALYIYVSMTNYMQEERKLEQAKRRKVQEDYTKSITKVFDITIPKYEFSPEEIHENEILCKMVSKLSSLLSLKVDEINNMVEFTKLIIDNNLENENNNKLSEDEMFNLVRSKTDKGLLLIERKELRHKGEEILRYVLDGASEDKFIKEMRDEIKDTKSQIILICEIYISMRSIRTYKKAYNHKITMGYMEKSFKVYFDSLVYDRFYRFDTDFEEIFDEKNEEL